MALARQTLKYLDSGNVLEALDVYKEALKWSPRVILDMAKPLGNFVIEKLRRRPPRWAVN
jgi:hypothetical protein